MKIIQLVEEDFVNYKHPAFYVGFPTCSFKCDHECGRKVCQNSPLMFAKKIDISVDKLIDKYMSNGITSSIVCGGLEPLDSLVDLKEMILQFRTVTQDDIVVYTGYWQDEPRSIDFVSFIKDRGIKNIIIKFGRFVPDEGRHYDEVLGVTLASNKQHGVIIS